MSHPFDLMCVNHPERAIDERGRSDRYCPECYINACNAGARWADAHWHELQSYNDSGETTPDGELLRKPNYDAFKSFKGRNE